MNIMLTVGDVMTIVQKPSSFAHASRTPANKEVISQSGE